MRIEALPLEGRERAFAVVLERGDELVSALERVAESTGTRTASLSVIGTFEHAVLGFFDPQRGHHHRLRVDGPLEALSVQGHVARGEGGERAVRLHAVLGDVRGEVRGGRLLEAQIDSAEAVLLESPRVLRRRVDPETDLARLDLGAGRGWLGRAADVAAQALEVAVGAGAAIAGWAGRVRAEGHGHDESVAAREQASRERAARWAAARRSAMARPHSPEPAAGGAEAPASRATGAPPRAASGAHPQPAAEPRREAAAPAAPAAREIRPAGITNRPSEEEQRAQAHLPPRGTARGETDPVLPPRPGAHAPPREPRPKRRRRKRSAP